MTYANITVNKMNLGDGYRDCRGQFLQLRTPECQWTASGWFRFKFIVDAVDAGVSHAEP